MSTSKTSSLAPARVMALVGVFREDWEDPQHHDDIVPVIAGVVDHETWNEETVEETDARWSALKAKYDPSGVNFEWREVWMNIDAAGLRAPFEVPSITVTDIAAAE